LDDASYATFAEDMTYEVKYAGGTSQIVLNVPHYDSTAARLSVAAPIKLPKGTNLIATAHYDNSANNKFNPNPNQNGLLRGYDLGGNDGAVFWRAGGQERR